MSAGADRLVAEALRGAEAVVGYIPESGAARSAVATVRSVWSYPRAADLAAQVDALIAALPPHNGAQLRIAGERVEVQITYCPPR